MSQQSAKPSDGVTIDKFHHILLWPLILRGGDAQIDDWAAAFGKAGWKPIDDVKGTIPEGFSYEEIVYFHPFVRDFLFGDGKTPVKERALRRMVRKDVRRVSVTIGGSGKPLDFAVERAELYLCKPNVLVFAVEVANKDEKGQYTSLPLTDVLDFQDQFRRIYPPFWWDGAKDDAKSPGLCLAKLAWSGLPVPSGLATDSPRKDFVAFAATGAEPPMFNHWRAWFGDAILPLAAGHHQGEAAGLFVQQIMDERIPAMSFLSLQNPADITEGDRDRIAFLDSSGGDPFPYDPAFLAETRKDYAYKRFSNYGTTYYCSGYGFAVVGRTTDFFDGTILSHFRHHYFRMGIIGHFQRAALLYFADELAEAVKSLAGKGPMEELFDVGFRRQVNEALMRFLKFRSRSYFAEITNQVQGRELHHWWFKHLGTAEWFDRVDATFDQLNEVLTQKSGERSQLASERLALAATWGLGISIVLAAGQVASSFGGLAFGWALLALLVAVALAWISIGVFVKVGLGSEKSMRQETMKFLRDTGYFRRVMK